MCCGNAVSGWTQSRLEREKERQWNSVSMKTVTDLVCPPSSSLLVPPPPPSPPSSAVPSSPHKAGLSLLLSFTSLFPPPPLLVFLAPWPIPPTLHGEAGVECLAERRAGARGPSLAGQEQRPVSSSIKFQVEALRYVIRDLWMIFSPRSVKVFWFFFCVSVMKGKDGMMFVYKGFSL